MDAEPPTLALSLAVFAACDGLQPAAVDKLKTLITWQRSSIARLAVRHSIQTGALGRTGRPLPRPTAHPAGAWLAPLAP